MPPIEKNHTSAQLLRGQIFALRAARNPHAQPCALRLLRFGAMNFDRLLRHAKVMQRSFNY
jgi:hypothetical protein